MLNVDWLCVRTILSVNVMDRCSGDPCLFIASSLLFTWKPVIYIGGEPSFFKDLPGWKLINPFTLPKYILPFLSLKAELKLNWSFSSPLAFDSTAATCCVAMVKQTRPLVVLIHSLLLSSSAILRIKFEGKPSAVPKRLNERPRGSQRHRPPSVANQRLL